jgi:hypothetical protein
MPFTWQININKSPGGSGYVYAPGILTGVAIADEVHFTNNDDKPHFPGLVDTTAIAGSPTTYFMANQIAPHSSSTAWVPGVNGTVSYADSLDTSSTRPVGSIVVTDPTAAPTATLASKETS